MMREERQSKFARTRRARRVRGGLRGTAVRPRLSVFRSLKAIRVQLIDDVNGRTLVAVTDLQLKATGTPTERATAVGTAVAQQAKAKGITTVLFDRGAYRYHGRVAALATAARAEGLEF